MVLGIRYKVASALLRGDLKPKQTRPASGYRRIGLSTKHQLEHCQVERCGVCVHQSNGRYRLHQPIVLESVYWCDECQYHTWRLPLCAPGRFVWCYAGDLLPSPWWWLER